MWHNEMPSDITPSVTGACLRFNDSAHRFEIILHITFFFQHFFFVIIARFNVFENIYFLRFLEYRDMNQKNFAN